MSSSPQPPLPPPPPPAPSPWDAHAAVYEQVWERSTSLWGRDALVLGQLSSNSQLLDVACGSGALALAAAAMGLDVTATDLSAGMIERLRAKILATASPSPSSLRITPRVVDGQTLDGLADASFDVVSSIFGIFLFPDREAAWRSAWRVLKPNGRLLATSWDANSANVRMVKYFLAMQAEPPSETSADPSPSSGSLSLAPAVNRTVLASTFREELEECGFADVRIHTLGHAMCFTSGQELVTGVLDNSAFRGMLTVVDDESIKRGVLDYAQMVLDGVDPFGEEAAGVVSANRDRKVEDHPLWTTPFALPGIAHVAVATKPTE